MVRGLDIFREHFSDHVDSYVLIGGAACTVVMEEEGLEFRATKDLDVVLYVEAIKGDFPRSFWDFIEKGGYLNRQKSTGKDIFYRFYSPENENFPAMIELFSRIPDFINLSPKSHLTPIPTNELIASLSAILMDDEYYHFAHSGKLNYSGLSILGPSHLIPLKARAWLDLVRSQASGIHVDKKDIRKHRNDVFRLYQLLSPETRTFLSRGIRHDMKTFVQNLRNDQTLDIRSLGIRRTTLDEVFENLIDIYGLEGN